MICARRLRRNVLGMLRHKWIIVDPRLADQRRRLERTSASIPEPLRGERARVFIDADAVLTPLLRGIALDNPLSAQIDVLQRTLLSRPNLEKLISKTDLSLQLRQPSDLESDGGRVGERRSPWCRRPATLFTITYRNDRAEAGL